MFTSFCLAMVLSAAPGDRLAVVNKSDSTLSLLELATGKIVATIPTGKGPHEVAVSADGRWAYVSDYVGTKEKRGHTVTVVDLVKMEPRGAIELLPHRRPHGSALSSDGRWLWVSCEGSSTVLKIDTQARRVASAVKTEGAPSHMVALSENNGRVYAASIDAGVLVVIDAAQGKMVEKVATGKGAEGLDVTADGKWVLVTNGEDDTLSIVDGKELKVVKTLSVGKSPLRVKASADGRYALVTLHGGNELVQVDLEKQQVSRRLPVGEKPIGVLIAPDGTQAWVANTVSNLITVVDLAAWKVTGTLTAGAEPDGLAFVPQRVVD